MYLKIVSLGFCANLKQKGKKSLFCLDLYKNNKISEKSNNRLLWGKIDNIKIAPDNHKSEN